MVQFGRKLDQSMDVEWRNKYMDYTAMKKRIKSIVLAQAAGKSIEALETRFVAELEMQVNTVVVFFLEQEDVLEERMRGLTARKRALTDESSSIDAVSELVEAHDRLCKDIVRLLRYVELNLTGIRKILKKHDKKVLAPALTASFLETYATGFRRETLGNLQHSERLNAVIAEVKHNIDALAALEVDAVGSATNDRMLRFRLDASLSRLETLAEARTQVKESSGFLDYLFSTSLLTIRHPGEAGNLTEEASASEDPLVSASGDDNINSGFVITRPVRQGRRSGRGRNRNRERNKFGSMLPRASAGGTGGDDVPTRSGSNASQSVSGVSSPDDFVIQASSKVPGDSGVGVIEPRRPSLDGDFGGAATQGRPGTGSPHFRRGGRGYHRAGGSHGSGGGGSSGGGGGGAAMRRQARMCSPSLALCMASVMLSTSNFTVVLPTAFVYAADLMRREEEMISVGHPIVIKYTHGWATASGLLIGAMPVVTCISTLIAISIHDGFDGCGFLRRLIFGTCQRRPPSRRDDPFAARTGPAASSCDNFGLRTIGRLFGCGCPPKRFKALLLQSAIIAAVGNLLYATARHHGNFYSAVAGRALAGCGNALVLNRRYIATHVKRENHRIVASALFLFLSIFGSSLGPMIGTLMAGIPQSGYSFRVTALSSVPFVVDVLTAPAWCFALLWTCFALALAIGFRDPQPSDTGALVSPSASTSPTAPATNLSLLREANRRRQQQQAKKQMTGRTLSGTPMMLPQVPKLKVVETTLLLGSGSGGGKNQRRQRRRRQGTLNWINYVSSDVLGPTIFCVALLLFIKLQQEAFMVSAPMMVSCFFQWKAGTTGIFLGILRLCVMPSRVIMGWLSSVVQERAALLTAQALTLAGMYALLSWSSQNSLHFGSGGMIRYILAAALFIVSSQLAEGATISILSQLLRRARQDAALRARQLHRRPYIRGSSKSSYSTRRGAEAQGPGPGLALALPPPPRAAADTVHYRLELFAFEAETLGQAMGGLAVFVAGLHHVKSHEVTVTNDLGVPTPLANVENSIFLPLIVVAFVFLALTGCFYPAVHDALSGGHGSGGRSHQGSARSQHGGGGHGRNFRGVDAETNRQVSLALGGGRNSRGIGKSWQERNAARRDSI